MPPPMRGQRRGAFTLVEAVLAITLVLSLVLVLLAFYRDALSIRESVTDEADLLAAERNIMDGMTNELRTSLAYPGLNIGMEGSGGQINFISTVVPGPTVWSVQDPMAGPAASPETDLQLLTYQLRIDSNFTPPMILGLERLCRRVLSPLAPGGGQQVRLMSPRIQFLNFRFYDGAAWQDSWKMDQGAASADPNAASADPNAPAPSLLPAAVEIILGTEPIPEEMDLEQYLLAYPTFRREVYVPAGAKPPSGNAAQGTMGDGTP